MHCTYHAFDNSDPCHEELFINRKLYLGYKDVGEHDYHSKPPVIPPQVIGTPRCTLLSQSILTWVKWLLSKADTEDAVDDWNRTNQDLQDQGYTSDIQHGDNFKNTTWINNPNSLKLSVSLFVDWFNPRGNKISGKVESTGVFALSCLNLPPSIRNKLSHMCLAGITPGPYSPDPHTFNHLLSPEPIAGRFVQVKLLCVYGDILATKKVVGYASHSATKFCSFCHAKQCDIHLLQLAKRRKKDKTISAAKDSKKADSVSAQEKILANTGVRWSELNRLTYWDPSRHVVLGVMHNWLEGILQGHFRYRWKFWAVSSDEAKKKRKGTYYDKPNKRRKTKGASSMDIDEDEGGIFSGSDDDDDDIFEDILLNGGLQGGFFSQDDIKRFRAGMKHVVLPPGVPHLPHNLGEPKHGKLSASQWHALFVFIIPIVLLDIYLDNVGKIDLKSNLYKFLVNTAHLVQCTNVVFARKFKPGDLKRFEMHYKKYSDTVGELFDNIKVQPNHHYSLHIPQQMTAWGPLAGVSEFAGERLIGFLQKIKTNNKIVPKGSRALSGLAKPVRSINCNGVVVGSMSPRNCVVFESGGKTRYGLVQQCYQYGNHLSKRKEFMLVSRITNLYPKRTEPIPTRPFRYLLFLFGVVVGKVESSEEAIDPSQVISLAAYRLLDKNTFSISENGIALIPRGYDAFSQYIWTVRTVIYHSPDVPSHTY
ncbi:hypothetical protein PSHT_16221 [Puccinia striiformis]|uniref:Uncharacterized protein n=1 Tax=Puccinia striiformis TaxID=27350 RepID=A0A2S4UB67_9BASI|nr:hypothetical protein PSHT_16221 [Puccinia striiformis]